MLRPLAEVMAEAAAQIDATRVRNLVKVIPAALRICAYLVRCKPRFMSELVDADKIDHEDFIALLHHNGISAERYEG
jgi:hypothetical protein